MAEQKKEKANKLPADIAARMREFDKERWVDIFNLTLRGESLSTAAGGFFPDREYAVNPLDYTYQETASNAQGVFASRVSSVASTTRTDWTAYKKKEKEASYKALQDGLSVLEPDIPEDTRKGMKSVRGYQLWAKANRSEATEFIDLKKTAATLVAARYPGIKENDPKYNSLMLDAYEHLASNNFLAGDEIHPSLSKPLASLQQLQMTIQSEMLRQHSQSWINKKIESTASVGIPFAEAIKEGGREALKRPEAAGLRVIRNAGSSAYKALARKGTLGRRAQKAEHRERYRRPEIRAATAEEMGRFHTHWEDLESNCTELSNAMMEVRRLREETTDPKTREALSRVLDDMNKSLDFGYRLCNKSSGPMAAVADGLTMGLSTAAAECLRAEGLISDRTFLHMTPVTPLEKSLAGTADFASYFNPISAQRAILKGSTAVTAKALAKSHFKILGKDVVESLLSSKMGRALTAAMISSSGFAVEGAVKFHAGDMQLVYEGRGKELLAKKGERALNNAVVGMIMSPFMGFLGQRVDRIAQGKLYGKIKEGFKLNSIKDAQAFYRASQRGDLKTMLEIPPREVAETLGKRLKQYEFIDPELRGMIAMQSMTGLDILKDTSKKLALKHLRNYDSQLLDYRNRIAKLSEGFTEKELVEIGAALEKGPVIGVKGDSVEAVFRRMTPKQKEAYKEFKSLFKTLGEEFEGILKGIDPKAKVEMVENYLFHRYVGKKKAIKVLADKKLSMQMGTPSAHERIYPTYGEASEHGLLPLTQNPAELALMYVQQNYKSLANRAIIKDLKRMLIPVEPWEKEASKNIYPKLKKKQGLPGTRQGGERVANIPQLRVETKVGSRKNIVRLTVDLPDGTKGKVMGKVSGKDLVMTSMQGAQYAEIPNALHEMFREHAQRLGLRPIVPPKFKGAGLFRVKNQLRSLPVVVTGGGRKRQAALKAGYVKLKSDQLATRFNGKDMEALIHPDVAPMVNRLMGKPWDGSVPRLFDAITSWNKALRVSFGGFHAFSVAESASASLGVTRWLHGLKKGLKMAQDPNLVSYALRKGLGSSPMSLGAAKTRIHKTFLGWENKLKNSEHKALRGLVPEVKGFRKIQDGIQTLLWDKFHYPLKLATFYQHSARMLADPAFKNVPKDVVEESCARMVNFMYGGIEKNLVNLSMHPKAQQILSWIMFAPDWTFSNAMVASSWVAPQLAGVHGKVSRKMSLHYWRNMAATLFLWTNAANKLTSGKWAWENSPGHEFDVDVTKLYQNFEWFPGFSWDGKERFVHAGKQAREVLRSLTNPVGVYGSKAAVLPQILVEGISGHAMGSGWSQPWMRQEEFKTEKSSIPQRALGIVKKFIPFALSDNSFMFTLPVSKGMSFSKAEKMMTSTIFLATGDDILREFAGKRLSREAVNQAFEKLLEAGERNGIDRDTLVSKSIGNVRSFYANILFEEIQKENFDQKVIDRAIDGYMAAEGFVSGLTTRGEARKDRGRGDIRKSDEITTRAENLARRKRVPEGIGVGTEDAIKAKVKTLINPRSSDKAIANAIRFLKGAGVDTYKELEDIVKKIKKLTSAKGVVRVSLARQQAKKVIKKRWAAMEKKEGKE